MSVWDFVPRTLFVKERTIRGNSENIVISRVTQKNSRYRICAQNTVEVRPTSDKRVLLNGK